MKRKTITRIVAVVLLCVTIPVLMGISRNALWDYGTFSVTGVDTTVTTPAAGKYDSDAIDVRWHKNPVTVICVATTQSAGTAHYDVYASNDGSTWYDFDMCKISSTGTPAYASVIASTATGARFLEIDGAVHYVKLRIDKYGSNGSHKMILMAN